MERPSRRLLRAAAIAAALLFAGAQGGAPASPPNSEALQMEINRRLAEAILRSGAVEGRGLSREGEAYVREMGAGWDRRGSSPSPSSSLPSSPSPSDAPKP